MIIIFEEYRSLYEWIYQKHRSWQQRKAGSDVSLDEERIRRYSRWRTILKDLSDDADFQKLDDAASEHEFLDQLTIRYLKQFQRTSDQSTSFEIIHYWTHSIIPVYNQLYEHSPTCGGGTSIHIRRHTSRLLRLLLLDRLISVSHIIWSNLSKTEDDLSTNLLQLVIELRILVSALRIKPKSLAQFLKSGSLSLLELHMLRDEFYALLGLPPQQRHNLLHNNTADTTISSTFVTEYDGFQDIDSKPLIKDDASTVVSTAAATAYCEANDPLKFYRDKVDNRENLSPVSLSYSALTPACAPNGPITCDSVVINQLLDILTGIGDRARQLTDICDKTATFLGLYGYRMCKRIETLTSIRKLSLNKYEDLIKDKELNSWISKASDIKAQTSTVDINPSERIVGVFVSLFGSDTNNFLMNMGSLISSKLLEKVTGSERTEIFVQCRRLLDLMRCKTSMEELPEFAVCEQLLADEAKGWLSPYPTCQALVLSRYPLRVHQVKDQEDLSDGITEQDLVSVTWTERANNPLRRRLKDIKTLYESQNSTKTLLYDVMQSIVRLKLVHTVDKALHTRVIETDLLKAEILLCINSETDPENESALTLSKLADTLGVHHNILETNLKVLQNDGLVHMERGHGHDYVRLTPF